MVITLTNTQHFKKIDQGTNYFSREQHRLISIKLIILWLKY